MYGLVGSSTPEKELINSIPELERELELKDLEQNELELKDLELNQN